MKTGILIAAALLAASPASAEIWSERTCYYVLESKDGVFTFTLDNGSKPRHCTIEEWPVTSLTARMTCDDGSHPQMTAYDKETVVFDGIELHVPTNENGICD